MHSKNILLRHHHTCKQIRHALKVSYELSYPFFNINFEVTLLDNDNPQWHTSSNFSQTGIHNWNLWDFDVVEFFIQGRETPEQKNAPYWEFELSPLGQKLALYVTKPREQFVIPAKFNFEASSTLKDQIWKASLQLPLDVMGIRPHADLYGNAFACLGKDEGREYWSGNINTDAKPDFHRPELFLHL